MYGMLSPHQASKESTTTTWHTHEMPLQVAVGLTMHTDTRSKFIIQFMHSIGASIDYARVLHLETQIATSVVNRMNECGGFQVPSQLVRGRFVFCAADNIDFLEDTPYDKGTLHVKLWLSIRRKRSQMS